MTEISQFVPAPRDEGIDKDTMREVRPDYSDEQFDQAWAGFEFMRERVNNPRRRIGGDVKRIGAVLFDPCFYHRKSPDE